MKHYKIQEEEVCILLYCYDYVKKNYSYPTLLFPFDNMKFPEILILP